MNLFSNSSLTGYLTLAATLSLVAGCSSDANEQASAIRTDVVETSVASAIDSIEAKSVSGFVEVTIDGETYRIADALKADGRSMSKHHGHLDVLAKLDPQDPDSDRLHFVLDYKEPRDGELKLGQQTAMGLEGDRYATIGIHLSPADSRGTGDRTKYLSLRGTLMITQLVNKQTQKGMPQTTEIAGEFTGEFLQSSLFSDQKRPKRQVSGVFKMNLPS